ncbi:MAG: transposase [Phycisphaerales bacterium]|nr:transposase [Phycisphaerales bacterium]
MKKFVGVDLHKQRIVVCVVNQARQVLTSARFTNAESIKLAAWLKALGSFDLVLEATASYEWFVKLVEPLAGRVLLAHPRKMRIIAESTRKSDKVDARVLAEFLGAGHDSAGAPTDAAAASRTASWCGGGCTCGRGRRRSRTASGTWRPSTTRTARNCSRARA